ncbi:MAG: hypothetical protein FWG21_07205 [Oscillospiraceae bacterium]|nr:hypothetical protein [Oscillospiraceae bacterium]
MMTLAFEEFLRLKRLVFRGARPLEYAKWRCLFEGCDKEEVVMVLSCYQNDDGGFGYELECNSWNPNSSPYITHYAIVQLERIGYRFWNKKHPVLKGILNYLSSGEYMSDEGWFGMNSVPSNNAYSHLPWFHYDSNSEPQVDIDITVGLSKFIVENDNENSKLSKIAVDLLKRYSHEVECGIPDFSDFDPIDYGTWKPWLPMPVTFVGSPDSEYFAPLEDIINLQLDSVIRRLENTTNFMLLTDEELQLWENNNPHPDGKRWSDREQTIGNYYWGSDSVINDIDLLKRFGRLSFAIPT